MTFEEAKELLNRCTRSENRDHAFGDREIYWTLDGKDVADGYFSTGLYSVNILGEDGEDQTIFRGNFARNLAKCGAIVVIGRNDETGPDEYGGA